MRFVTTIHSRLIMCLTLFAPLFYLGMGPKYPWVLFGVNGQAVGILFFLL